jgi:hypothetical protein
LWYLMMIYSVVKTRGNKRKRQTFFATCCAPV